MTGTNLFVIRDSETQSYTTAFDLSGTELSGDLSRRENYTCHAMKHHLIVTHTSYWSSPGYTENIYSFNYNNRQIEKLFYNSDQSGTDLIRKVYDDYEDHVEMWAVEWERCRGRKTMRIVITSNVEPLREMRINCEQLDSHPRDYEAVEDGN